jgi:hypothetical protein
MENKYKRKSLEIRFPNTFEAIYGIMNLDDANELEERWIKENIYLSLPDIIREFVHLDG